MKRVHSLYTVRMFVELSIQYANYVKLELEVEDCWNYGKDHRKIIKCCIRRTVNINVNLKSLIINYCEVREGLLFCSGNKSRSQVHNGLNCTYVAYASPGYLPGPNNITYVLVRL